ncbi:MAG: hypothetical protein ACOYOO_07925, partial [Saprospiraceae bacterium]
SSVVSNYYLARSAVKNLFIQPLSKESSAAEGGKRLFTQPQGDLWGSRDYDSRLPHPLLR